MKHLLYIISIILIGISGILYKINYISLSTMYFISFPCEIVFVSYRIYLSKSELKIPFYKDKGFWFGFIMIIMFIMFLIVKYVQ